MKIDGLVQGQSINLSDLAGILDRVNVGDVIKAKILEMTSNDLILKLFDGSTIKAATSTNIDAKQGGFLDLVVKSKDGNQLVLETVKNIDEKPTLQANELKSQLTAFDIKPSENNLKIAKEIKSSNLPLNKEVFEKIANMVTKFQELTPSKAAFLLAANIAPEENNISAMNQYVEGKAKIALKLDDLLQSLGNIQDDAVLKNIDQQFSKLGSVNGNLNPEKNSIVQNTATNSITNPEQLNSKALNEALVTLTKEGLQGLGNKELQNNTNIQFITGKMAEFINENEISTNSGEKFMALLGKESEVFGKLPINEQSQIKNAFESLFLKLKNDGLLSLDKATNSSVQGKGVDTSKLKDTIKSTFDNFFIDIKSDNLKDEINVKNLYKDIYGKLEVIKDSITNSLLPNKNEIIQQVDNMQNNIRFMNELSNHNTYVQIPLNIWDKNTTGELYILKKDSKRKKIDPENATVFISLNTKNLGQIDSLIGVNKKNITLNIRVEDQEIIDFLKENHKELYNRLQEKGFKLVDMKYRIIEEEANILNIQDVVKKESGQGQGNIDYRL